MIEAEIHSYFFASRIAFCGSGVLDYRAEIHRNSSLSLIVSIFTISPKKGRIGMKYIPGTILWSARRARLYESMTQGSACMQLGGEPSDCGGHKVVLRHCELRLCHLSHQPAVLHVTCIHPSRGALPLRPRHALQAIPTANYTRYASISHLRRSLIRMLCLMKQDCAARWRLSPFDTVNDV